LDASLKVFSVSRHNKSRESSARKAQNDVPDFTMKTPLDTERTTIFTFDYRQHGVISYTLRVPGFRERKVLLMRTSAALLLSALLLFSCLNAFGQAGRSGPAAARQKRLNAEAASMQPVQENRPVIARVDDAARVTLAHTTHASVRSARDLGHANPDLRMERMLLVLGPLKAKEAELRSLLTSLQDKKSPNYHVWLTPEQFGTKFGASTSDLNKITAWLRQKGFDGVKVAKGRGSIEFSGSAQVVEQAFQTRMMRYELAGKKHIANASDISIPAAMAPLVQGVELNDFSFSQPAMTHTVQVERHASGRWAPVMPGSTLGDSHFLSPGDFANIYDLNPVYSKGVNGAGEKIAIVARSKIALSDIETFRQAFHLPPNDPHIIVNGNDVGVFVPSGDTIEASFDAEWAGAVAPNATIDVVDSPSTATTDGVVLSAEYIVDNNLADVMSMSYEACEQNLGSYNDLFHSLWRQAAAEGISVFVATGDQGAADCDPNAPSPGPAQGGLAVNGLASTPFNTAVGGTQFNENGNPALYWNFETRLEQPSAVGYIPEVAWNESCDPTTASCFGNQYIFDASGGGASTLYSKPGWQSAPGVPNDGMRDVPDVSLSAALHDGYLGCVFIFLPCSTSGAGDQTMLLGAGVVAGTSLSSPSFAGIMALVDQNAGARQGLANPVLYHLAAQESSGDCNSSNRQDPTLSSGCIFNDITGGNNSVPGQAGYAAGPGFDAATGLGSVNAANLVGHWNSAPFVDSSTTLVATGATSIQHGQSVGFTVNVQAQASGNIVPTGSVTLIAENSDSVGSGGTVIGTGLLSNGTFSASVNSLPGGQYNVIAHYGGDGTFRGGDSNPVSLTVTPEDSSITLSALDAFGNPLPSPITHGYGPGYDGGFFSFHAQVTPASGHGVATGSVILSDGGVPLSQVPVDQFGAGDAMNCLPGSPVCLSIGQHTITASYSGDGGLNPSAAPQSLSFTITQGHLILGTFTGIADPLVEFEPLFFAVGIIPPTGTVTIYDNFAGNNTAISSPYPVRWIEGTFPLQLWFALAPGAHGLSFQYSGDSTYLPGVSDTVPLTISAANRTPTQITLTALTTSMAVGESADFHISVTSTQSTPAPTGLVLLNAAGLVRYGTLPPDEVDIQAVIPGTDSPIQAVYVGDSIFAPSVSPPVPISVAKATPTVAISASSQMVTLGSYVSLAATITPPSEAVTPAGTVQFFDSFNGGPSAPFGPPEQILLSGLFSRVPGVVVIPELLPAGTHVFTVAYSGNANYNAVPITDSSPTVTVTVVIPSATTTALSVSRQTVLFRQQVEIVATVTPQAGGTPTGTVTFRDGPSIVTTIPLSDGAAILRSNQFGVGKHTITATYRGDTAFNTSVSAPIVFYRSPRPK
jgi:hypothetical protein